MIIKHNDEVILSLKDVLKMDLINLENRLQTVRAILNDSTTKDIFTGSRIDCFDFMGNMNKAIVNQHAEFCF